MSKIGVVAALHHMPLLPLTSQSLRCSDGKTPRQSALDSSSENKSEVVSFLCSISATERPPASPFEPTAGAAAPQPVAAVHEQGPVPSTPARAAHAAAAGEDAPAP